MIRHKLNIIGVGRGTGTNLSRSRAPRSRDSWLYQDGGEELVGGADAVEVGNS